ncbi:PAS domain S-box protein [Ideonella sp. A 288]|uniref:PAS domain-containing hybrid sensor histidine kinase/response regulator n=1 Tax=Ideonella sp. A 288 TaxID=1962181 RepID=UPI000B4B28BA|nr:PAS domain S-box protein [Ideonella sp. A 288]
MSPIPSNPRLLIAATLRAVFGFAAAGSVVAAFNLALATATLSPAVRGALMAAYGVIGVASLLAMRLSLPRAQAVMLPLLLLTLAVIGSAGLTTGWGLRTPGLYFLGVLCCMTCTVARRRDAVVATLASLVLVGGFGLAEATGLVPAFVGPGHAPLLARTAVQWAAILFGAGAGLMLAALVRAHVRESREREERFRDLLGIAAAAYWETDEQLRICHVSRRSVSAEFMPLELRSQVAPWDSPHLQFEPGVGDRLRAQMQAREPVRDAPMWWRRPGVPEQRLLISGEPRFDAARQFTGYWGVARDVTAEHRAREALIDTELRYRDLFRRTPTPMVLHHRGTIIDANEAAATLFGFDVGDGMAGLPLHMLNASGDKAEFDRRMAPLTDLPLGEALPLATYRLVTRDGRALVVKATGVRADIGNQPATLSIFIDETAQHAAAAAQQRSEQLLRQVVSMSPDVITLTDLDTGRYEMVNESFTRLAGYEAGQVIGRTAHELGIWGSLEDRERLVAALTQSDSVTDVAVSFVHRDGHRLPMLVSASRFIREGRPYLVINARDMSEANRDRIEREAIMANASVGLAHTRQRRFVMVNPRFEQMYGWPPGQLVGQSARVVWSSDADYEAVGAELGPALRHGEQVEIERIARRCDGSTFLARMRAKAIDPQHPSSGGTIWIAEDVTAQRQAEAELARARDAAEAANRAKSAFLANTSHEIRTPLNGLVGLARLARQPGVEPERMHQYLEQIGDSAETLSMIISDILDLSKIEAGRLEVDSAPFDLPALLHSLHRAYASLAHSHDLAFEMALDPHLPELVQGDALRVRQILANYLHNALKFTPQGRVSLSARCLDGDRIRFEVCDTGPGIDAATQARLFKPFTQADESITRRFGGTGLGLSICRELAHLMGGTVGLDSQAGRGSCFHAELPLPPVSAEEAASTHGALDHDALRGAHVLLVEDNAVNMMIGVALLEQWGIVVAQAEDGAQAIEAVERSVAEGRPFDAVLMDVQMPGMSGYEATRRLRERWDARRLPVIALTAAALVSERERALAIGMNDFVTKPIESDRLRQALRRVLS